MIERRHLVAALLLHLVLFALLFAGAIFHRKIVAAAPIEAVLVADPREARAAELAKQQEQRQREQDQARAQAEQQRAEQARQQEVQQQKKAQQDEEQIRQEQQQRKQSEAQLQADAERKRQEDQRKKAAEEQKRQEEQQKKTAEAELKRQVEAERKEQERVKREREAAEAKRRKDELDAMMAAELQGRIQQAQADWGQVMAARIRKFWIRPPASPDDFSCVVEMQLTPDGQVRSARVVRSCGSTPLDRSVEAAVIKASPMPSPGDSKAFVPNVRVNFTPRAVP